MPAGSSSERPARMPGPTTAKRATNDPRRNRSGRLKSSRQCRWRPGISGSWEPAACSLGAPMLKLERLTRGRSNYRAGNKYVPAVLLHVPGRSIEPMRAPPHPSRGSSVLAPRPALESVRVTLSDGAGTTVQGARFERARFDIRVVAIEPCSTVLRWCVENGAEHAIVGGFYLRPGGPPLGDLRIGGSAHPTHPFDPPWGERRACIHADDGRVLLAPRRELPTEPAGDVLQAGPMLVAGGRMLIHSGEDHEGFSA